ncbi:type II toxin-antitoxin system RelE/ParE family toxin [Steroidobacter flavus]|uniref:Type II toxin-antitoxin system RelE/ParE family toxin n=1 Tax=Steroidobacter flavus TaxID=1842136 RepID=A0ABV8SX43_9GAMM
MAGMKRIYAAFYESRSNNAPVREWLLSLDKADRRIIGEDIATVEFGWPVGMPVCRPLGQQLWEVRSSITGNRIARVLFSIEGDRMVLLHGFVKKTQKTPPIDLALARKRLREIEE